MEVREIPIELLEPNDYNPNEMTPEEFNECKAELQHLCGVPKPIVVRPNGQTFVIVDGEHNWRAARELGFTKLPCELLEISETEAMRQTYKRNQHGRANPVKLGRMFQRALEGLGCSQRELARQYEVSEGTIRNALLYAEAASLRNGYAFERLPVRQVRLYLAMPPVVRDRWLDAGADTALVVPQNAMKAWLKYQGDTKWTDESFENLAAEWGREGGDILHILDPLHRIHKAGLAHLVGGTKRDFRQDVERVLRFWSWEHWFHRGQEELVPKVRPYTEFFVKTRSGGKEELEGEKLEREGFARIWPLLYFRGEFHVSPQEFAEILANSKAFGAPTGKVFLYPQFNYVENALQLRLVERGLLPGKVDVKTLPNPAEELLRVEIEQKAPEYLRRANLPLKVKEYIWHWFPQHIPGGAQIKPEVLERAKEKVAGKLAGPYLSEGTARIALEEALRETQAQDQLCSISDGLAIEGIVKFTALYDGDDRKEEAAFFKAILRQLNRLELMALFTLCQEGNRWRDTEVYLKQLAAFIRGHS